MEVDDSEADVNVLILLHSMDHNVLSLNVYILNVGFSGRFIDVFIKERIYVNLSRCAKKLSYLDCCNDTNSFIYCSYGPQIKNWL